MPPSVMSSPPLRIELRHSRVLRAALVMVCVLAAAALWRSAAPPWLLPVPLLLLGLSWPRARQPRGVALVLRGDGSAVVLDDEARETPVEPRALQRRGPLTVLTMQDGARRLDLAFLPDTLDRGTRRELVLWFARHRGDGAWSRVGAHV